MDSKNKGTAAREKVWMQEKRGNGLPGKNRKERGPMGGAGDGLFLRGGMVEMMGMNPGPGISCRIGVGDDIFVWLAHRFRCKCKR